MSKENKVEKNCTLEWTFERDGAKTEQIFSKKSECHYKV